MFKIIKSDRRYNGFEHFKFIIDVRITRGGGRDEWINRVLEYNTMRDWCRETWGPSCELIDWQVLNHNFKDRYVVNEHWSWMAEHGKTRLYLRTQKEANWFKLKYGT